MTGEFGAFFRFGENLERLRTKPGYWTAFLIAIVASFAASVVAGVIPVVGWLVSFGLTYLAYMVGGHGFGQWAAVAYSLPGPGAGYAPGPQPGYAPPPAPPAYAPPAPAAPPVQAAPAAPAEQPMAAPSPYAPAAPAAAPAPPAPPAYAPAAAPPAPATPAPDAAFVAPAAPVEPPAPAPVPVAAQLPKLQHRRLFQLPSPSLHRLRHLSRRWCLPQLPSLRPSRRPV